MTWSCLRAFAVGLMLVFLPGCVKATFYSGVPGPAAVPPDNDEADAAHRAVRS